ncbi:MAG TPA: hypothetical protein VGD88_06185 [Opitutaceae bacterium]
MASDSQILRLQRKAARFIRHADGCVKGLPTEPGSMLLDTWADSAIENLSEALFILTRVKILARGHRAASRVRPAPVVLRPRVALVSTKGGQR